MRLLLILSACLLVGCGNDYGIEKGVDVEVYLTTEGSVKGQLYKVTKQVVILKTRSGEKTTVPRSRIKVIWQDAP